MRKPTHSSAKDRTRTNAPTPGNVGIDLYWLPLGAGGNFVRLNGRIYEANKSRVQHRHAFALYHSGLVVFAPEGRYLPKRPAALG